MIRYRRLLPIAVLLLGLLTSVASANEFAYFTEDFGADAANWGQNSFPDLLDHVVGGGPGGAGDNYATSTRSFAEIETPFGTPIVFRGQANLNSSNGDYVGNWVEDHVVRVEAMVRHDFEEPINFGGRFASPMNTPGASFIGSEVPSNTWTSLTFFIDPTNVFDPITNPTGQIVTFGGGSFETVFDEIGNIQISVSEPLGLTPSQREQAISFDLDAIRITAVPEPATLSVVGTICALMSIHLRRRALRTE